MYPFIKKWHIISDSQPKVPYSVEAGLLSGYEWDSTGKQNKTAKKSMRICAYFFFTDHKYHI